VKAVPVADSVGMVLSHDLTRIVPGEFKGPAFKKGHVIRHEDIPVLLSMGKDHIYVWNPPAGHIHENDAAYRIARTVVGSGITETEPHEGKINFNANYDGLFRVNKQAINHINSILNMCFSTLHDYLPVNQAKNVAATRVIPLTIDEKAIEEVESLKEKYKWFIEIKKYQPLNIGVVITGNEVYYKRIEDAFGPALKDKLNKYGYEIQEQVYMPDDINKITEAILALKQSGKDLVLVAGGMSVDPDDRTPGAIKNTGANVITYGAPVIPGAMLMVAQLDETKIIGLPACVIYSKTTVFDVMLPRILAVESINREDITQLGVGGLCQNCEVCYYPNCGFGRN